jgi:methionyl-tRNA formyltransferase
MSGGCGIEATRAVTAETGSGATMSQTESRGSRPRPWSSSGGPALRIAFFGTPDFAVPTLRRLAGDPRFAVVLVVTQPDRPAGRGRRLETPPVKRVATDLALPIYQPASLRGAEERRPLIEVRADLFVVAAFGLIFGPKTLAIPPLGCVNLHASLLPRYRGASPVAAAILNGDERTGVTLMLMDRGLDTGPTLAAAELTIAPDETTATLSERLATLGGELVLDRLPAYAAGDLAPVPQPAAGASLTRPLLKADGWLDWRCPAVVLERQVRAMWPWPRAWTTLDGEPLQIHAAAVRAITQPEEAVGTLIELDGLPVVACAEGSLALERVQPAGGRPMDGRAFLAGRRYALSQRLGATSAPAQPVVPPIDELDV